MIIHTHAQSLSLSILTAIFPGKSELVALHWS